MELAALEPDTQVDLSGGIRQKGSLLGLDLTASGVAIRGQRTASSFATLRVRRDFFGGQLGPELEATYIRYRDGCGEGDPTCTGDLSGRALRLGGTIAFLHRAGWLALTDYRFARNRATKGGMAQPVIDSHALFVRLQRSF